MFLTLRLMLESFLVRISAPSPKYRRCTYSVSKHKVSLVLSYVEEELSLWFETEYTMYV